MGGRHMCCHKQKLKKGLWSPEEDEKLVRCITKHGHGRWSAVPKLAGLERCGKSCRLRWINYLRPDLKRGTFSESEENLIIELHSALGNRWSQIAARLPGRTDNEIKNFWNSCVKKKMKKMGIDPNTHKPIAEPEIPVACRAENSTDSSIMDSPNMELTVANQSNLSHDSHETLLSPREAINCCNPLAEVSHHDPSLPSSSPSFTKIFKTAHIIDNCSSNPQLWLHQNESSNAQDTHGLANESSSSSSYPAAAQDNSSNNAHMAVAYPFTVPEMKQLDAAAAAFQLIAAPCDPISSDKMPLLNHEGMPMMNYCENGQLWEQQDKNQAFAIHMGPSNEITASSSSSSVSVSVSSHASSLKWPEFLEQQPLPAAAWALQSPSQHPSSEDIQRLAAVLDQTH